MENYFNYFTEIEEQFQRRRGGSLLLSTLDWALIETWKDAGIPLEAVLRGIDGAFERYEKRPSMRKVNSLAYCAQEVLAAAEEMKEAVVGASSGEKEKPAGFQTGEIIVFLCRNADQLLAAKLPQRSGISVVALAREAAATLRKHLTPDRTFFLSIHQIADAAKVCDRFVLLSGGRVAAEGKLDTLIALARQRAGHGLPADFEEVFLALT